MSRLLAFLAGGAFFTGLGHWLGPTATVVAAGLLALVVVAGTAWEQASAAADGIGDRERARDRWLEWFGRG